MLGNSALTREIVDLRVAKERLVGKNGELKTKVCELERKYFVLEVRKIELEYSVSDFEGGVKLKDEEQVVLRGVVEDKEAKVLELERCVERLHCELKELGCRRVPKRASGYLF